LKFYSGVGLGIVNRVSFGQGTANLGQQRELLHDLELLNCRQDAIVISLIYILIKVGTVYRTASRNHRWAGMNQQMGEYRW
jgi:hypothetical protein